MKTLYDLLFYSAEKFGTKPAIRFSENGNDTDKSFIDLFKDSVKCAEYIHFLMKKRSHIAIIGRTSYNFIVFYNAIFLSGNAAVPLSPDTPEDELVYLCRKADVDAVITDGSCPAGFIETERKNGTAVIPINNIADLVGSAELPFVDPDAFAMIMFTSGTTGDKKGVMLSSSALISNVLFKEMSYEGEHVALNVLPMYHIFCFSCDYLKNIKDGVTICLNGEIGNIGRNLLKYEPTVIRLVPMVVDSLQKKVKIIKRKQPELSEREAAEMVFGRRLRSIIVSGAYLNSETAEAFEKMGISIRQGYGMTETGPRIAVPNGKTSIYSVGAVIDLCDVRISDGEIQVKSPSLMLGYYKDEKATREVFTSDGWFKTGDMGHIESDRQLYITGRKKNLIILSNGENISPESIEKKLYESPAVGEVLVYGENGYLTAEFLISSDFLKENSAEAAENEIRNAVEKLNSVSESEKEIVNIKFRTQPFEKTLSGKIKRQEIIYKE